MIIVDNIVSDKAIIKLTSQDGGFYQLELLVPKNIFHRFFEFSFKDNKGKVCTAPLHPVYIDYSMEGNTEQVLSKNIVRSIVYRLKSTLETLARSEQEGFDCFLDIPVIIDGKRYDDIPIYEVDRLPPKLDYEGMRNMVVKTRFTGFYPKAGTFWWYGNTPSFCRPYCLVALSYGMSSNIAVPYYQQRLYDIVEKARASTNSKSDVSDAMDKEVASLCEVLNEIISTSLENKDSMSYSDEEIIDRMQEKMNEENYLEAADIYLCYLEDSARTIFSSVIEKIASLADKFRGKGESAAIVASAFGILDRNLEIEYVDKERELLSRSADGYIPLERVMYGKEPKGGLGHSIKEAHLSKFDLYYRPLNFFRAPYNSEIPTSLLTAIRESLEKAVRDEYPVLGDVEIPKDCLDSMVSYLEIMLWKSPFLALVFFLKVLTCPSEEDENLRREIGYDILSKLEEGFIVRKAVCDTPVIQGPMPAVFSSGGKGTPAFTHVMHSISFLSALREGYPFRYFKSGDRIKILYPYTISRPSCGEIGQDCETETIYETKLFGSLRIPKPDPRPKCQVNIISQDTKFVPPDSGLFGSESQTNIVGIARKKVMDKIEESCGEGIINTCKRIENRLRADLKIPPSGITIYRKTKKIIDMLCEAHPPVNDKFTPYSPTMAAVVCGINDAVLAYLLYTASIDSVSRALSIKRTLISKGVEEGVGKFVSDVTKCFRVNKWIGSPRTVAEALDAESGRDRGWILPTESEYEYPVIRIYRDLFKTMSGHYIDEDMVIRMKRGFLAKVGHKDSSHRAALRAARASVPLDKLGPGAEEIAYSSRESNKFDIISVLPSRGHKASVIDAEYESSPNALPGRFSYSLLPGFINLFRAISCLITKSAEGSISLDDKIYYIGDKDE